MIKPELVGLKDFPNSELTAEGMKVLKADMENVTVVTIPSVEYVKREEMPLHLHIMVPVKQNMTLDKPSEKYPLIVYVQGSAWFSQMLTMELAQLSRIARKGFVIAVVEYRPSTVKPFPAQIQDTKTAVRFLRRHADEYQIDPEKVVIWGDSSGGHTAVMTGITAEQEGLFDTDTYAEESCKVKGIVDFYGPMLVDEMQNEPSTQDHISPESPEGMILGHVNVLENHEKALKMSPLPYICPQLKLPPVVIFHGSRDRLVPFGQSVILYNKLKECGQEADFYRVELADHGGPAFWNDEVLELVEKYVREFLK